MFVWSAGLLALLHLCSARSDITTQVPLYPFSLDQFHERDSRIQSKIPDSNKFSASQISVRMTDPVRALNINQDGQNIDVVYGKPAEHRGVSRDVFRILYGGFDSYLPVKFDESMVTCKLSMGIDDDTRFAKLKVGSRFPGVFELLTQGLVNDVHKEIIWKLYSVQQIVVEEGRYFNISLDFIEASLSSKVGHVVIDNQLSDYLNLQWDPIDRSVLLYGLPGVGDLNRFNTLSIQFKKKEGCTYQQRECSQIKVNLNSVDWAALDALGPSFEAIVSPRLLSVDDRISAAKCLAELHGGQITDLRGLSFTDYNLDLHNKHLEGLARIQGMMLPGHSDCDTAERLAQMVYPSQLPQCKWTLLSLKHDFNYLERICPHLSLVGLEKMGRHYLGSSDRQFIESYLPRINYDERSRITNVTLPPSEELEGPTDYPTEPAIFSSSSVTIESLSVDDQNRKSSTPPEAGMDDDANPTPLSANESDNETNETFARNELAGSGDGSDLSESETRTTKPSWDNLRDISYQSRELHFAIVLGVLAAIAVVAFVAVFCYYRRRTQSSRTSLSSTSSDLFYQHRWEMTSP